MTEETSIETTSPTVGCDGGGLLGHPLVYLKIPVPGDGAGDSKGEITCPYCSRHYVLTGPAAPDGHGQGDGGGTGGNFPLPAEKAG